MEYRFNQSRELRVINNDGKKTLVGYAAVFDSLSHDLGGWKEKITRGAFSRSLASAPDVLALSEHDPKKGILGRTKANTLRLQEDGIGLRFECDLPLTTLGNDIAESVSRSDLDACSFGFIAQDAVWDKTSEGVVRTLIDVDLFDVTITSMPAYPATSVQLRSRLFPDGEVEIPGEFRSKTAEEQASEAQTEDDESSECDNLLASIIERRLKH